jgi:Bax protein
MGFAANLARLIGLLTVVVAPVVVAHMMIPARGVVGAYTSVSLAERLRDRGLVSAKGEAIPRSVPRLFTAKFPNDWATLTPISLRKRVFIAALLPLVLRENELVRSQRARVVRLLAQERRQRAADQWLQERLIEYEVAPGAWDQLLHRMGEVPVSLALAQAAIESGWGSSRFSLEGNAVFGQWTQGSGRGMVPTGRPAGALYEVKTFRNLGASVAAYIRNLNTHRAYAEFRARRTTQRMSGSPVAGTEFASTLSEYAETGEVYVDLIRQVIMSNNLDVFDAARLAAPPL